MIKSCLWLNILAKLLIYCNIWIRAAFAMVEQCAKGFGKVETFVSIYEKIKVMVVPLMPINFLVVLTMLPTVSVE